jgi:AraC family transcriptional regulator
MSAEIVQAARREKIEYRFRAPFHLLVLYDQAVRDDGDTFVEGLPRSSLRDLRKKLTFVPAGCEYHEWHQPRALGRAVFFYLDPAKVPVYADAALKDFSPRLYFEDATVLDTALKLATLIERGSADHGHYLEALGVVLSHELVRLNAGMPRAQPRLRGGLTAWQQRVVTSYIEEHLSEQVSLATLAGLVRLSAFYFCRAFKQSFGIPPHRYHSTRRIERAKALLVEPESSVTEVGMTVGFSETSSFTAAFRKATGMTPTAYRRSVG